MKAKCLLAIPLNCKGPVMDSMKEFLSRNYSGFSFKFSSDANVNKPTLQCLEANDGAFGFVNKDSNLATQAQISVSWALFPNPVSILILFITCSLR